MADRARELWADLGGAGFAPHLRVAVSPRSRMCPPGWAGVVVIDGTVLVTAPDRETGRRIEQALSGVPADSLTLLTLLTDAEVRSRQLPIAEMLGPTTLAYLDAAEFQPRPGGLTTTPLGLDDPALRPFLLAADPADLEESGLEELTTPAFTVQEHGQVVAAAGYRDWPCRTAHLCVLTAAAARSRGLAHATGSAAVAHAIENDRLPQWRARIEASRRVARALGFRELGAQVSFRLADRV